MEWSPRCRCPGSCAWLCRCPAWRARRRHRSRCWRCWPCWPCWCAYGHGAARSTPRPCAHVSASVGSPPRRHRCHGAAADSWSATWTRPRAGTPTRAWTRARARALACISRAPTGCSPWHGACRRRCHERRAPWHGCACGWANQWPDGWTRGCAFLDARRPAWAAHGSRERWWWPWWAGAVCPLVHWWAGPCQWWTAARVRPTPRRVRTDCCDSAATRPRRC